MPPPLAYFLTWTCYGTWLHGDERESVDEQHRTPGTPRAQASGAREQANRQLLAHDRITLNAEARTVVESTIRQHCELRDWPLLAINVRSNHVHVIVQASETHTPERVMNEFKAWSTRRLREAGAIDSASRVWTHHGSTRWINDRDSLSRAIDYVMNQQ